MYFPSRLWQIPHLMSAEHLLLVQYPSAFNLIVIHVLQRTQKLFSNIIYPNVLNSVLPGFMGRQIKIYSMVQSSSMSYQRGQGWWIDGVWAAASRDNVALMIMILWKAECMEGEKVGGMESCWRFGNSMVDIPCTTNLLAACMHSKRRTISVWSIFWIFPIFSLIVWHHLKSLPTVLAFHTKVFLHFVSISSSQLVLVLLGLPHICLVHATAGVNAHVLSFPWVWNWKRWSGFISCLLSPPPECSC